MTPMEQIALTYGDDYHRGLAAGLALAKQRRRRRAFVMPPGAEVPPAVEYMVRVCSIHNVVCLIEYDGGRGKTGVYCPGKKQAPAHECTDWFTRDRRTGKIVNQATASDGAILEVEP